MRATKALADSTLVAHRLQHLESALYAAPSYLKRHGASVSAFYVSNVEQYLRLERVWGSFCGNAARLPIDEASTFIRAGRGGRYSRGTALTADEVNDPTFGVYIQFANSGTASADLLLAGVQVTVFWHMT